MKLKKIILQGFKSFADRTPIEFHEGITCIVGPNGCGKSNIGDAIRWVLGEQSAKSLRGGKMHDVIFAGTESRKSLPFAEVTIVFSEVEGEFPLPYDEVAITRRVERSGDSSYLINGQNVRLKDVQYLLQGTGVGKNNFSIFEQGKIDQIIHLAPIERRAIFDEAAGINRFLQRKKETLKKLEEATLNVSRLEDIEQEVVRQIGELQEQSKKAIHFKERKERLENLEKGYLVYRWHSLEKKRGELKSKEEKFQTELILLKERGSSLSEDYLKEKQMVETLALTSRRVRESYLRSEGEKELRSYSAKETEEKLKELSLKALKAKEEIALLLLSRQRWGDEMELLRKKEANSAQEFVKISKELETHEAEFLKAEKRLASLRALQSKTQKEYLDFIQRRAAIDSELKQVKVRIESQDEKKRHLEERLVQFSLLLKEKEMHLREKKDAFEKQKGAIEKATVDLREIELKLKQEQEEGEKLQKQIGALDERLHKHKARKAALEQLKKEFAGFSKGGKFLLKASEEKANPLFGLVKGLYEYVAADQGKEKIFDAVMQGYTDTLVVETLNDLERVFAFAKEKKIARFSLLCKEFFEKEVPIGEQMLGEIEEAKDIDECFAYFQKHRKPCITPSGCYIDTKGIIHYGEEERESVFTRESEVKKVDQEILHLEKEKETLDLLIQESKKRKQTCQEQRIAADQALRKLEMKGVEANFEQVKAPGDLERLQKERKHIEEEIDNLKLSLADWGKKESKLLEDFLKMKEREEKSTGEHAALEGSVEEASLEWSKQRDHFAVIKREKDKKDEEQRGAIHALKLLEVKDQETARLIERLNGERESALSLIKTCTLKMEEFAKEIVDLEERLHKQKTSTEESEEKLRCVREKLNGLEDQKNINDREMKEKEGKIHDISIQLAHVDTGQESLLSDLQERFSMEKATLHTFDVLREGSFEKAEKEIKELRSFVENAGDINLAAIEEVKKAEDRATELKGEIEDLTSSKNELMTLIKSLDDESRTLFKETFENIRACFRKNFQILFRGGEADLALTQAEDILEAGVEISAKPPGKQMRSLTLLSGGEKCLTAMALLFALFEVKPSPFCVLDEIDAPLDDANVERFLNVVKEFIDRCQFVIVTHNKRTMSLADRLFGVSMQEKGVSKILSMEFNSSERPNITVAV